MQLRLEKKNTSKVTNVRHPNMHHAQGTSSSILQIEFYAAVMQFVYIVQVNVLKLAA